MRIYPSFLAADFACPEPAVRDLVDAGFSYIHLDVMDGHFVPNLSFGMPVISSLRARFDTLRFDAHLMIENPLDHIESLLEFRLDSVSIHREIDPDVRSLRDITREHGVQLGLAVNPDTPLPDPSLWEPFDYLLLMTVQPGFGGQAFRDDVLPKIERAAETFSGPIQVDGGIGTETIGRAREAGADWFVSGSSIFGKDDPGQAARELERIVN